LEHRGGRRLLTWSGQQASPYIRASRNAWNRVSNIRIFEYRFRVLFSLADSRGQCAIFDDFWRSLPVFSFSLLTQQQQEVARQERGQQQFCTGKTV
jgi:hypothetical protein